MPDFSTRSFLGETSLGAERTDRCRRLGSTLHSPRFPVCAAPTPPPGSPSPPPGPQPPRHADLPRTPPPPLAGRAARTQGRAQDRQRAAGMLPTCRGAGVAAAQPSRGVLKQPQGQREQPRWPQPAANARVPTAPGAAVPAAESGLDPGTQGSGAGGGSGSGGRQAHQGSRAYSSILTPRLRDAGRTEPDLPRGGSDPRRRALDSARIGSPPPAAANRSRGLSGGAEGGAPGGRRGSGWGRGRDSDAEVGAEGAGLRAWAGLRRRGRGVWTAGRGVGCRGRGRGPGAERYPSLKYPGRSARVPRTPGRVSLF